MYKHMLCILFLFACIPLLAQNAVKKYTLRNHHLIKTVDPTDTNYADLKVIGDAIGEARIVMLGEADHGDAPTFLAKTRLIQYLVERNGFSVVAFESDFFSLNAGVAALKQDWNQTWAHLRNNIFELWTMSKQCQPLFQYLTNGMVSGKVQVTGFDSQHQGAYFTTHYLQSFLGFLDTSGIAPVTSSQGQLFRKQWDQFYPYFKRTLNVTQKAPDSLWQAIRPVLQAFYQQSKNKYSDAHFWTQELQNLIAGCEKKVLYDSRKMGKGFLVRDQQMAHNLQWLAMHKYPGQKIIVWAANGHIIRKHTKKGNSFMPYAIRRMGGFFTEDPAFDQSTYVLGFTAAEGRAGRLGSIHYDIPPPRKNSFESWLQADGADYSFIDFKQFRRVRKHYHRKFYMKATAAYPNVKADWCHGFDGVFYIREMYPCTR